MGVTDATAGSGVVFSAPGLAQCEAEVTDLFDSGVMHGLRGTKTVDVSVKGVRELRLEVTDGGDNYFSDMATWAEARLLKSAP